jgi:hypothetical protein
MLKKFLLGAVAVFVLLALIGLVLPAQWKVERSVSIAAKPAAVYQRIANLETWPQWTVWNRREDPEVRFQFDGGVGAGSTWRWDGPKLGRGTLAIQSGNPHTGIAYEVVMDGMNPVRGRISLAASGDATDVVWRDEGELGASPIDRWFAFLMLPSVLGSAIDQNLANLKREVESGAVGTAEASAVK